MSRPMRPGFTLIELLVVVAIIAVIAVVVILALNPAELLRRSRDATRLSDISSLSETISLYATDVSGASLGSNALTYISMFDLSATSTAGDQCQGLNMPALSTGLSFQCAMSTSYKNVDSTGWVPINFNAISSGNPLSALPVDPLNQTTTDQFYTFGTDGTRFVVTALMESQKQKAVFNTTPPVTSYPGLEAQGTNVTLSALYNPNGLVGYWNFEEGGGANEVDQSGNGSVGTWGGTLGAQFGAGRVGTYSGVFNGSDNKVTITASTQLQSIGPQGTISVWVNPAISTTSNRTIFDAAGTGNSGAIFAVSNGGLPNKPSFQYGTGASTFLLSSTTFSMNAGTWYLIGATWNASGSVFYVNGAVAKTVTTTPAITPLGTMYIGSNAGTQRYMWGNIDDLRVYNRAMSAAEMQALYYLQL